MKMTFKLIIVTTITTLLTMLAYELAVNGFLHKDIQTLEQRIEKIEKKVL